MRTRLRHDLTAAIKTRDLVVAGALRSALSAIENAEATEGTEVNRDSRSAAGSEATGSEYVAASTAGLGAAEVERRVLSDSDVRALVQAHVDELSLAAAEYEKLGREDVASQFRAEADVLRPYLKS